MIKSRALNLRVHLINRIEYYRVKIKRDKEKLNKFLQMKKEIDQLLGQ